MAWVTRALSYASSPVLGLYPQEHADGLHARSLEICKLVGLYEKLMKVSTEVGERARWSEIPSNPENDDLPGAHTFNVPKMARVMRQKIFLAPNARMK